MNEVERLRAEVAALRRALERAWVGCWFDGATSVQVTEIALGTLQHNQVVEVTYTPYARVALKWPFLECPSPECRFPECTEGEVFITHFGFVVDGLLLWSAFDGSIYIGPGVTPMFPAGSIQVMR